MLRWVPAVEPDEWENWATLGPQVVEWCQTNLVHGPGALLGRPYEMAELLQLITYRAYQIHPQGSPRAGQRRFSRVVVVLRKGSAKTEWAAELSVAEMSPTAPVRFDRWGHDGQPVGRPVVDPYVPMVAYNEAQAEDLAYGSFYSIITNEGCPARSQFSATKDGGTTRANGVGKLEALSGSPGRDGARPTFQHFDETHRMTRQRQRDAHGLMLENVDKLDPTLEEAWTLETTTMWLPGQESVAEASAASADAAEAAGLTDGVLYVWLGASEHWDWDDPDERRSALVEAAGLEHGLPQPNIENIWRRWEDPKTDRPYLQRVWGNIEAKGLRKWIQPRSWGQMSEPDQELEDNDLIAIGFDGSKVNDATVLVAVRLEDGFTQPLRFWERPTGMSEVEDWQVDRWDVDDVLSDAFYRYRVALVYCDPWRWETEVSRWEGRWPKKVLEYATNQHSRMIPATWAVTKEIEAGDWRHNDDPTLRRHVLSAERSYIDRYQMPDDTLGFKLDKPQDNPQGLIDGAVALVLAHKARRDAIAQGALEQEEPAEVSISWL